MQINEGDDRLFGQYNMLHQNEVLDLIYERLNLSVVLPIFLITFILGYVFYGTFFSLIGAGIGSESDGQQFSIPVIMFLLFALYAGYFSILHPESDLTRICEFIPFTSPVIIMVKTCQGYPSGSGYLLVVSLFILFLSSLFMLYFASRIFRNGLLEFGHSLSIRKLFIWLKSDS
jgi:ABC-2 type transport system permease protein